MELEAAQNQSRLVERLRASENIYEQAECLQGLVHLLGRESRNPVDAARAGGKHQPGNLAGSTLAASQSGAALERAAPDRGAW